jgi:peptidoglycan/LPS O-acetylase OafA/YrhL
MVLPMLVSQLINFGGTGVHAFIFVSGFGLYLSHLRKPLSFSQFLKKRFTKIYLPYIIVVALTAAISLFIPVYDNSIYAFFGHVLLYKMFDETIIGSYGYQFWFISTIIQFYLIFPLIVRLKKMMKDGSFTLLGIVITILWGVFIFYIHRSEMRIWGSFFLQFIWEFMLGMVCAERFYKTGYAFWSQRKTVLALVALLGLGLYGAMALRLGVVGHVFNDFPALLGYTALGLLIFNFQAPSVNNFILFTAKISYPLFLVHILVLRLVQVTLDCYELSFGWLTAAATLLLSYAAAVGLNRVFKKIGVI